MGAPSRPPRRSTYDLSVYRLRSPAFAARRVRHSGSRAQMNARSRAGALFAFAPPWARGNAGDTRMQCSDAGCPETPKRVWSLILDGGSRRMRFVCVRTSRPVCILNPSTLWSTNAARQPAHRHAQRDSMRASLCAPARRQHSASVRASAALPAVRHRAGAHRDAPNRNNPSPTCKTRTPTLFRRDNSLRPTPRQE